jgi:hypothetical protein
MLLILPLLALQNPRNRHEDTSMAKLGVDVEVGITVFMRKIIFFVLKY